jgi:osmotically-inducible protein OsmY
MSHVKQYLLFAVLAFAVVGVAACERPGDRTENRVSQALRDAEIENVDVDYDDQHNIVRLSGTVATAGERNRAEEIATDAVGTGGQVLNEIAVEGMEDDRWLDDRDSEIRDQLDRMVEEHPTLQERDIDFEVNNGAVKITGNVNSAEEKEEVERMVRSVDGVTDVANALEVEARTGQPVRR